MRSIGQATELARDDVRHCSPASLWEQAKQFFQRLFVSGGGKLPNAGPSAADLNKINHIFGNAGHNLEALVERFGSPEAAYTALKSATDAAARAQGLSGVFETVVRVGGSDVTVRGAVVDGVVKMGTAFIP